jgi:hypothetical protein
MMVNVRGGGWGGGTHLWMGWEEEASMWNISSRHGGAGESKCVLRAVKDVAFRPGLYRINQTVYVCMYCSLPAVVMSLSVAAGIRRHNLSPYLHFAVPSGNKLPTCVGLQSCGTNPFRLPNLLHKCAPCRWNASWQIRLFSMLWKKLLVVNHGCVEVHINSWCWLWERNVLPRGFTRGGGIMPFQMGVGSGFFKWKWDSRESGGTVWIKYVGVNRCTFRHVLQNMQLTSVITSLKGLSIFVSL